MMKNLIVLLVLFSTICCAQTKTYHVSDKQIVCAWERSKEPDLAGYRFYVVSRGDTVVFVPTDTSFAVPDTLFETGDMFFGVSAFDSAGNHSKINWAHTQCNWSEWECWKVNYDTTAPGRSILFFIPEE